MCLGSHPLLGWCRVHSVLCSLSLEPSLANHQGLHWNRRVLSKSIGEKFFFKRNHRIFTRCREVENKSLADWSNQWKVGICFPFVLQVSLVCWTYCISRSQMLTLCSKSVPTGFYGKCSVNISFLRWRNSKLMKEVRPSWNSEFVRLETQTIVSKMLHGAKHNCKTRAITIFVLVTGNSSFPFTHIKVD